MSQYYVARVTTPNGTVYTGDTVLADNTKMARELLSTDLPQGHRVVAPFTAEDWARRVYPDMLNFSRLRNLYGDAVARSVMERIPA